MSMQHKRVLVTAAGQTMRLGTAGLGGQCQVTVQAD